MDADHSEMLNISELAGLGPVEEEGGGGERGWGRRRRTESEKNEDGDGRTI